MFTSWSECTVQPDYCENVIPAGEPEARVPPDGRYAAAATRLARLERMAADPALVERLIADGRYLRLCAAIAMASEIIERIGRQTDAAAPTGERRLPH